MRRAITVGELYRTNRRHESVVPQIRLSGRWLADAGFNIGDVVTVEVGDQELYVVRRLTGKRASAQQQRRKS